MTPSQPVADGNGAGCVDSATATTAVSSVYCFPAASSDLRSELLQVQQTLRLAVEQHFDRQDALFATLLPDRGQQASPTLTPSAPPTLAVRSPLLGAAGGGLFDLTNGTDNKSSAAASPWDLLAPKHHSESSSSLVVSCNELEMEQERQREQQAAAGVPRSGNRRSRRGVSRPSRIAGHLQTILNRSKSSSGGSTLASWTLEQIFRCATWWMRLEEPPRTGCMARMVKSQTFDLTCAIVVLFNAVYTIYAEDVHSRNITAKPNTFMQTVEPIFLVFYCLELAAKLLVHRIYFLCNNEMAWNIFDFLLVGLAIYEYVLVFVRMGEHSATSMTFMRSFRLIRLTRIIRMLRVIRLFRDLQTMLQTLINSLISLFWCLVMLAFILVMFSLIFVQAVAQFRFEAAKGQLDAILDQDLKDAFGTVGTTMTTLYMASTGGDDWKRFYDLVSTTGNFYGVLLLFYIAFFHFAVINVLTGIFVDHAQKVAQQDRDVLILEQRRKEDTDAQQLRRLCYEMDTDRSGTITPDEFLHFSEDENARALLASIGLDIQDAEVFFDILCALSGSDQVEIEAFVDGCLRLKGSATSIDMQSMLFKLKLIEKTQDTYCQEISSRLDLLAAALVGHVAFPPHRQQRLSLSANYVAGGSPSQLQECSCRGSTSEQADAQLASARTIKAL
eukprot:TRINITY_DN15113_c0_g2_i1.p1 TRINITY_DN15113_c0_g2~~TRINITY_DN15113_c0_g2_i1.p1  ORF type:complete len:671 (+),score=125.43 TRINITY_DN15113_c0_g2_i1:71-2083(+)